MQSFYIDRNEAIQIAISVVAIAFAFSLALGEFSMLVTAPLKFLTFVFFSLAIIGVGFIFHEMAHKAVANHYGAQARFVMWTQGLAIMLLLSVFGFLFAAPGAVYIYSNSITRKENGLISLAGPVTNILIVFVFVAFAFLFPIHAFNMNIWALGAQINLILAIFNMLPMIPLDGSKVLMGLLSREQAEVYAKIEPYGFIILILLIMTNIVHIILSPIIGFTVSLLLGGRF